METRTLAGPISRSKTDDSTLHGRSPSRPRPRCDRTTGRARRLRWSSAGAPGRSRLKLGCDFFMLRDYHDPSRGMLGPAVTCLPVLVPLAGACLCSCPALCWLPLSSTGPVVVTHPTPHQRCSTYRRNSQRTTPTPCAAARQIPSEQHSIFRARTTSLRPPDRARHSSIHLSVVAVLLL